MKLKEFVDKSLLTQTEIAKLIGIPRSSLNNYMSGRRTPGAAVIKKIEEITKKKVRLEDFLDN